MQYFIPADNAPPLRLLRQAFSAVPPAVARAAIEAYTQPGAVILDPFAAGLGVIQTALELERKIIAASFNPINLLAISATLWPVEARAALTHLADAPKGSLRLRDHLRELYVTRCPTCGREAAAQHFVWDRERNEPIEKHVDCSVCGENIGVVEADDLSKLKRYAPRGLAFWMLHGRVIDRAHEDAERVSDVLDAYTPRTQAALSDILSKFDALSEEDRSALRPALLAMFDLCTTLHTSDESRYPSGLKAPARFLEKNVWLELERQVSLLSSLTPSPPRVATVDELLASSAPAVCVLPLPARELVKHVPAQTIPLLLTHPPLPRPGFWSLSAVWAAWLWGRQDYRVDALRPLLSRKRTSWEWQWRAIGAALHAVQPALRADARTVMTFPADEDVLDSVLLAAASAHQVIDHLTCDPHDGVRATWTAQPAMLEEKSTANSILRDRAEPTNALALKANLLAAWGRTSQLSDIAQQAEGETPLSVLRTTLKTAFEDSALSEIEPHQWWLRDRPIDQPPLADRVERAVVERLRDRDHWRTFDLLGAVYRHFPDQLTPDRALLATTIQSYAEELPFDQVRLRSEDHAEARTAEVEVVRHCLVELGQRWGFETNVNDQAVEWCTAYRFVIQTTAEITPLLQHEMGVLVIPGGRATLLQVKLARDARVRDTAWRVLKFSSLRQAAQQNDLTAQTFAVAFGLHPPIEQPAIQIQLL